MSLKQLRIKFANFIAPEIREEHVATMRLVQSNCDEAMAAQRAINTNMQGAVSRANDQAEGLYADAYLYVPDKMREKWVALLGLPVAGLRTAPRDLGLRDFGEL